jgi:hypothetical protein
MAIMLVVKMPSRNIGPKKCCIFGVRRKGTASFEAKIGAWFATPRASMYQIYDMRSDKSDLEEVHSLQSDLWRATSENEPVPD